MKQWLDGSLYSKIFRETSNFEDGTDYSSLKADSGEFLAFREVSDGDTLLAVGFRHDNPDQYGRLWRTEAVIRFSIDEPGRNVIRLRTACVANAPQAIIEVPKKPYLIKSLLMDYWGGSDGFIVVSDRPFILTESQENLDLAAKIVNGKATNQLPVVYISSISHDYHQISRVNIEKLAYDLGGIAHVVVEPTREFSFRLREIVDGRNTYGGSVGIYTPINGLAGRLFRSWQNPTEQNLCERVRDTVTFLRSSMPAAGWDWSELQEFALRQRRTESNEESDFEELENIYKEEIDALREQISDSKSTIENLNSRISENKKIEDSSEIHLDTIKEYIGGEIYNGEILDRFRLASKIALIHADREGLDSRTIATLGATIKILSKSKGLGIFLDNLKRSTTDVRNLHERISSLLEDHGFDDSTTNKHAKMIPRAGMVGLGPITVPLSASDHRAAKNMRSQIINELGLGKLDF